MSTDIRDVQGPDEAHALVRQPDGKLVAAGVAYALALHDDGKLVAAGASAPPSANANFALARYHTSRQGHR